MVKRVRREAAPAYGIRCKQIGAPIDYQPMVFADLIPAVDSSKIDVIATNMAITPEREQKVDCGGSGILGSGIS